MIFVPSRSRDFPWKVSCSQNSPFSFKSEFSSPCLQKHLFVWVIIITNYSIVILQFVYVICDLQFQNIFSAKGIKWKKRERRMDVEICWAISLIEKFKEQPLFVTASCLLFSPQCAVPPWIFALLVRMDAIVRVTYDSFSRGREPELLAKLDYPLSAACSRLTNSISDGAVDPGAGPGMSGC